MKKALIIIVVVIGVLFYASEFTAPTKNATIPNPATKALEQTKINSIEPNKETIALNAYRLSKGRKPLEANAQLVKTAQAKADEMCKLGYFNHTRPGNRDFATIAEDVTYSSFGENLAEGYSTTESTLEALKNSPSHNENMLDDWERVGIATNPCNGRYLTVQHYAK